MKAFSDLYDTLEELRSARSKVAAMGGYFRAAAPEDAVWAVYLLSGRWSGRVVPSQALRTWAAEESGLPSWLFEESCDAVRDVAEAAALLVPEGRSPSYRPLHYWIERRLLPLSSLGNAEVKDAVAEAWSELDFGQRFLWNKLVTGGFRSPLSRKLVIKALAEETGLEESVLAHRLAVSWEPSAASYRQLFSADTTDADKSRRFPFCLARSIETEPERLGPRENWQAEWKWDGLRAQVVRRGGRVFIWSRGGELITERFPEVRDSARTLADDLVLDGMLLAYQDGKPLPFNRIERRFVRKSIPKRVLRETPVSFLAFDLLELEGSDLRGRALQERRELLERVFSRSALRILLAPLIDARSWEALSKLRESCRERLAAGLILKDLNAPYADGRERGVWWKWDAEPFSIDAVLMYAETNPQTSTTFEYTFAVWDSDELVPVATTSMWPSADERGDVERFIEENTLERFGPVRSVKPSLVCEIAFDGVSRSSRHKAGVTIRSPHVLRLRTDLDAAEAGTAGRLRELAPDQPEPSHGTQPEQRTLNLF